MAKWRWALLQTSRQLWVRATLIGALGIAVAILAALADRFVPFEMPFDIGNAALNDILTIIATSMLTVTTFSLSVMTAAYGLATSNVTPRATRLLLHDTVTQNVLSTFLGSFLFSIVGIVVSEAGAYGPRGRAILFVMTIAVIGLIVVALVRWINYLIGLGLVDETTNEVERTTHEVIKRWRAQPVLGGQRLEDPGRDIPEGAAEIVSLRAGYVQHIDMSSLSDCCEDNEARVFVLATPGTYAFAGSTLARITYDDDAPKSDGHAICIDTVRDAFSIGKKRTFDDDVRFGFVVLSEIGLRALSAAINDPGTAIDVIGRSTRLLTQWAEDMPESEGEHPHHPRIHVPGIDDADIFDDAFRLIARDGAAQYEVHIRLQKSLRALGRIGSPAFREAARHQALLAMERAEIAMTLEADKALLREIVAWAQPQPAVPSVRAVSE